MVVGFVEVNEELDHSLIEPAEIGLIADGPMDREVSLVFPLGVESVFVD